MNKKLLIWGFIVLIFIVIIVVYFKIHKFISIILSQLVILVIAMLSVEKSKKLYIAIPLIITIIFTGLNYYDTLKDTPHIDIIKHSFKGENILPTPNKKIDFEMHSVTLITLPGSYMLFFHDKIKDPFKAEAVDIINPYLEENCSDCTTYYFTLKEKGDIDYPIHLNLYSKHEINQKNKEPGVQFECGEGMFSKNKCLITINKIDHQLKLIFTSKDDSVTSSILPLDLDTTEAIYNSRVFQFSEGAKHKVILEYGDGKKAVFPELDGNCYSYQFNKDDGKFTLVGECTIW